MGILLLIPVLIICFFLLFILSKQDFVLLRQNISLSEVFDRALIILFFAILSGRVFFIINALDFSLFNVLAFFHLFRFPGVSPLGFFIGGAVFIFLLFRNKKGLGRIFDIFTIAFVPLYLLFIMRATGSTMVIVSSAIISVFIFYFFVKAHNKYITRDGSISLLFLLIICVVTFALQGIGGPRDALIAGFSFSQILSIPVGFAAAVFLLINQRKSRQ